MKALIKTSQNVILAEQEKPHVSHADGVVIRVAMTGICRTDVYVAEGLISAGKDNLVLGHEFSGIVDSVGEAVTHVKPGDRVCVMPFYDIDADNARCKYAHSSMMGVQHDGSIAEYAYVPAYTVYALPDEVSFMMGAYMEPICASMAVLKANIHPEQKGIIYGDNRISQLTLRIMQAKGFNNVTCYDSGQGLGTLETDCYDFIIETLVTTQTFADMLRAVKPGGTIVLKSRQHVPVEMNIAELVKKDVTLEAVNYADFADCIALAASGTLNVEDLFGDIFQIEDYENAFAQSKGRESKKLFLSAANDLAGDDVRSI